MSLRDFFRMRADGRAEPAAPPEIEPMDAPKMTPGKKALVAVVGTAAAGLIAFTAQWEGKPGLEPHWDRIGQVYDVCYGDTIAEKRTYTIEECKDMLALRLSQFGGKVLDRNPTLEGHDPQVLAASSLAYNIGVPSYRRSTVARRFEQGRWRSACDAFLMWTKAKGREIRGLRNRREAERKVCLRNIPARYDR